MYNIAFISVLVAIVIIIAFIVFQFFKLKLYKDIHNKENVSYIINLSGFMVTLIAVLISIYAIKQANDDRKDQETKFKEQMDISVTQKSILDSSRKFLDSMNKSFNKLNTSVNNITGKLENIPNQIDNISGSFQSLNDVSQKQYSIMFEEYMTAQKEIQEKKEAEYRESLKRPRISVTAIECDRAYNPAALYILNDGDLAAVISWLILEIPDIVTSEQLHLDNVNAVRITGDHKISYRIFNIGEVKEKEKKRCSISWNIINNVTDSLYAKYKLSYTSRNQTDTVDGSILICDEIQ